MWSTELRVGEGVARGAPRGVFCAIGVCHDCRMIVDGEVNVRTCLLPARAGMIVETQQGFGTDATAGIESDR